jgi:NAD(P)H dehydrogenase (quinone)
MGRVIVGILEDPASHRSKVYPLFGPVEYSYQEAAQVLSRVLGKKVEYKQVGFDEFKQALQAAAQASAPSQSSRALSAKGERTPEQKAGDEFLFQHLHEVSIDHQNGIFAGTNDLVEKLGGRPPMTLEAFIEKHRAAFV